MEAQSAQYSSPVSANSGIGNLYVSMVVPLMTAPQCGLNAPAKWTCANDSTSCSANAVSANQVPFFDRNKTITFFEEKPSDSLLIC